MTIKSLNDLEAVRLYLNRVGAQPRSLKTAIIKETHGVYWRDVCSITFNKKGFVSATVTDFEPTDDERKAIAEECGAVEWPTVQPLPEIIDPPPMIANATKDQIFEFRDTANKIVLVQVRIELENDKKYVPWTYWSDGEWRNCEPDGPLPLYNANRIAGSGVVFIHEGAKAARAVQRMVDGATAQDRERLKAHPWGEDLADGVHIGWIGGALNPTRTDWTLLKRAGITRAYIVADNDKPGREAVPPIAKEIRMPTFSVQFTDEFPSSFDLADPFPAKMFGTLGTDKPFYVGPDFKSMLHPATWATDKKPNPAGTGRPIMVLRESFRDLWAYVEEADTFVCTQLPQIIRTESVLNKMLAPFSDASDTCALIVKTYRGRSTRMAYKPDNPGLMVTSKGSSAVNLHVGCTIPARPGDASPLMEFLDYMFVREDERYQAKRWIATLIARPEIRMGFALLLVSETQGIGKNTLAAGILAPLVGINNVGFPGEADLTSSFNGWIAQKRLAFVSEIYSGSSWKAYNMLKGIITDPDITVNDKYARQYVIENWCHIVAASNSMRALKMENDDRRWFYPQITESPWPQAKFEAFNLWIKKGGLSIVRQWAIDFGDYVKASERAPMTARKRDMIEGSRSEAQSEAHAIAEMMVATGKPQAVLIKDVVGHVRAAAQSKVFDTDYELKRVMAEAGCETWKDRIKVAGRLQYVILTKPLRDLADRAEEPLSVIREHIIKIESLTEKEI